MIGPLPFTVIDGIKCYSPEVAEHYADYPDGAFDLTDRTAAGSFWVRSRNRLFKHLVCAHAKPAGQINFLDIGCGTGDFVRFLSSDKRLRLTGSEIYRKGLIYAQKHSPELEFIQLDITKGVIGHNFDAIVALDVIEHIDDDMAALANIERMLQPGGVAIIAVPQHMFMWSALDEIVKHKRRYSRAELVGKMKRSGLSIRYVTSFVFTLFPVMVASRWLDRKRGQARSDEATLQERVTFSPLVNRLLDLVMRVDETLIGWGLSLPFGGTLVVVGMKVQD